MRDRKKLKSKAERIKGPCHQPKKIIAPLTVFSFSLKFLVDSAGFLLDNLAILSTTGYVNSLYFFQIHHQLYMVIAYLNNLLHLLYMQQGKTLHYGADCKSAGDFTII